MSDCRCGDCKWWDRTPGYESLEWRSCIVPIPKWAVRAVVNSDVGDEQHVSDCEHCDTFTALDAGEEAKP